MSDDTGFTTGNAALDFLYGSAIFILYILWVLACYTVAVLVFTLIVNAVLALAGQAAVVYNHRDGWHR